MPTPAIPSVDLDCEVNGSLWIHPHHVSVRHPLDLQNTSLLRAIPGLELIAKSIMGPVLEQVLVLENLSTSIKIGPQQLPSIHKLLTDAVGADWPVLELPDKYPVLLLPQPDTLAYP